MHPSTTEQTASAAEGQQMSLLLSCSYETLVNHLVTCSTAMHAFITTSTNKHGYLVCCCSHIVSYVALRAPCHSRDRWLHLSSPSCYPLSVAPLTLLASVLLSQKTPTSLRCFSTFISSTIHPLFALFPFHSLSLFLGTPHYPLSAFLILPPISHCLSRP